jgi:hypothetical protein
MTSLVQIIAGLMAETALAATDRATYELPRGLWLVYYPPAADDAPARLIVGRYLNFPSMTELRVVRDALIEAIDYTSGGSSSTTGTSFCRTSGGRMSRRSTSRMEANATRSRRPSLRRGTATRSETATTGNTGS